MNQPIISIHNLSKKFKEKEGHRHVEVFRDLNLSIHEGEFLILLGPSGCGKSTFLRILAGLDFATSGAVLYGKDFDRSRMAFVFQNFGILPWLTIYQNVELGLLSKKISKTEMEKEVKQTLHQFGLTEFKERFPHELSGGMKQRVGLARAFIIKPSIIFLDEPFSELDFYTATLLRNLLLDMWKQEKTTVVMVSHYIEEAIALADRIAVFSDRPNSVIKTVIHNDLPRPRNSRSEPFFKIEDDIIKYFS